jgi:hypothetical protein
MEELRLPDSRIHNIEEKELNSATVSRARSDFLDDFRVEIYFISLFSYLEQSFLFRILCFSGRRYTKMSGREKPHLNLIIIGHVDHGKSTSIGHLFYDAGAISEKAIKDFEEEAKALGKESFKYAWVLDNLKEERERGLTIDLAFYKLESDKHFFTVIDSPGHRDFVKNMVTGASQADGAVLFISAKRGEYEAGTNPGGQTREHAFLARTLGVNQLVVAEARPGSTPSWPGPWGSTSWWWPSTRWTTSQWTGASRGTKKSRTA